MKSSKTSVLLDSNILLDVFLKRTPFFKDSYDVFNLCLSKKIHGIIAAHSITNLWYILRKDSTAPERREIINTLLECFEIAEINKTIIQNAINRNNFVYFFATYPALFATYRFVYCIFKLLKLESNHI